MGVLCHLQGRIPQLEGYHHSKDHLVQDLSSLWQDHQILQLCHRDLPWFLLVPLDHPFNPQHLAAIQGILMTEQLAIYSGKC